MHRLAPVVLATLLAASAPALLCAQAQTPFTPPQATSSHFTDPANLAGERVSPRTGRELPIDGGLGANNQPDTTLGLQQLLRKLNTRASILNIVAHPDDEDGGMLTLYARGYGARVADISLTRGEGGQNAMTGDFEDALGLLRTQELLSNDRSTGVTQMFGTEVDFGFSKTKPESFAKWGHDRVLYDVVRAIRIYRPLVLTATFIGNPTDGHGQHQVSGEIAQEAFVAAGDPNVFPELTREGILPWQPLKMYARVPTYAISDKGLFDYATNQYVPAEFTNYVTGVTSSTPPSTDIVIHEGATDPLLTTCAANPSDLPPQLKSTSATPDCRPLSYVQFARIGLGLQRSQIGPGVRNAPSGPFDVPYHLYGSCLPSSPIAEKICHLDPSVTALSLAASSHESQPNFFSGIDTSVLSLQSYHTFPTDIVPALAGDIDSAVKAFDPAHPEAIAPTLADALHIVDQLIHLTETSTAPAIEKYNALHELRIKRVQLNNAVALALKLQVDATAPSKNGDIVTSSATTVHVTISADPEHAPQLFKTLITNDRSQIINANLPLVEPGQRSRTIVDFFPHPFPTNGISDRMIVLHPEGIARVTRPYFTRPDSEQPFYDLTSPEFRNAPSSPPALTVQAEVLYQEIPILIARIVHSDAQPVQIIPPVSLVLNAHAQALPLQSRMFTLTARASSPTGGSTRTKLQLTIPAGWTSYPLAFIASPDKPTVAFTVHASPDHLDIATVNAVAWTIDGRRVTEGFRPIGYGDLPRTNFYTPATDRIVPVDLKLPPPNKRRIGYLEGTGDDVPAALSSIGLKPTMLTVADLTPEKLSAFDTVILGVRTYNAHPDLHGAPTQALLDFARNGGNVVVQYQTREFTADDAPFPLSLGSDEKVVDETDPVKILHPDTTLFTTPNHIVTSDFDHFIEERGHGFLGSWDPHYTALTETHDPGQAPQKGGLITVQLGRGRWTYCAFALYRQLPEAVPGAFRLFTNLLTP